MKKIFFVLITLFPLLTINSQAQTVQWRQNLGNFTVQFPPSNYTAFETADNGFFVAVSSFEQGVQVAIAAKIDKYGQVEWTYPGKVFSAAQLNNGDIILLEGDGVGGGPNNSYTLNSQFTKLDAAGNVIMTSPGVDSLFGDLIASPDGGFALYGIDLKYQPNNYYHRPTFIAKYDDMIVQQNIVHGFNSSLGTPYYASKADDGTIYAGFAIEDYDYSEYGTRISTVVGNNIQHNVMEWNKYLKDIQAVGNDLHILGSSGLALLDNDGTTITSTDISAPRAFYTKDGGLFYTTGSNYELWEVDPSFAQEYYYNFGGPKDEYIYDIEEATDGGTLIVGLVEEGGGTQSIEVLKIAPNACSLFPNSESDVEIQEITCPGESDAAIDISVFDGTPPYTFNWSNGESTEDISGLPGGSYTLTIVDAGGCTRAETFDIVPPATLYYFFDVTEPSCNGESSGSITLEASGGTPPYTYLWHTGATTQGITNFPAGNFYATITDDNDCQTIAFNAIGEPSPIILDLSSTPDQGSSTGTATVVPNGGTPPYTYLWDNGETTASISGLAAQAYSVTVTDANGCQIVETVTVDLETGIISYQNPDYKIVPNPTAGSLHINTSASFQKVQVFDFSGRFLMETDSREFELPAASGIYLLSIQNAQEDRFFYKVIKH